MEPEQEFDFELKFPWYKKLLFTLSPTYLYRRFIVRQKYYDTDLDKEMYLFADKRIDIVPFRSESGRGFKIVIDLKRAINFIQDGDHFVFEGDEWGGLEPGDVTIFDHAM